MKQSLVRCITYNYYPNRTDSNAADRKVIAFSRRGSLRSSNFSIFRFFDFSMEIDQVIDATSLCCVVILPLTEDSSNVTTLISSILGVRIDFNRSSHLHHGRQLADFFEVGIILHFFNFLIKTLRNFSPVRQYKKKLHAKFQ